VTRVEFGHLRCTAGLEDPCGCGLCKAEAAQEWQARVMRDPSMDQAANLRVYWDLAMEGSDKSVTWVTEVFSATADTTFNAERFRRENEMTKHEMFNPQASDGALTWVALRLIPVTLALALVFECLR
jgi:hypothetical protein